MDGGVGHGGVGLRNGGKLFRSLISYLINQLKWLRFYWKLRIDFNSKNYKLCCKISIIVNSENILSLKVLLACSLIPRLIKKKKKCYEGLTVRGYIEV